MSRLRVVPIVEGHGEMECVRILLERLWYELLGGEFIQVLLPVREPRGSLVQEVGLHRAVSLAHQKLSSPLGSSDPALVLILIDADEDCPGKLGPILLESARKVLPGADVACVLAKYEYETWFAASAESLTKYLEFPDGFVASEAPEDARLRKAWVEGFFRGPKYNAPRDQAGMTHAMDLALCRSRSPSFAKLCRELEQRVRRPASTA